MAKLLSILVNGFVCLAVFAGLAWLLFGFLHGFHHIAVFGILAPLVLQADEPAGENALMWGEYEVLIFPGRFAVSLAILLLVAGLMIRPLFLKRNAAEVNMLDYRPLAPICLVLAVAALLCGAGGMVLSCGHFAVLGTDQSIAGASGFVAGAVLIGCGLVSLTILATRGRPRPAPDRKLPKSRVLGEAEPADGTKTASESGACEGDRGQDVRTA